MGDKTGIEWTDATWNPIRGCSLVSEGCRNCYAMRVAARFSGAGQAYEGLAVMGNNGPRWTGKVRFIQEHLEDPIRWKRPRRIFVNSMSDLFHEDVYIGDIERIFKVMDAASHHTFQILTKRPERMARIVPHIRLNCGIKFEDNPLPNVWLGVSAEDQKTADERIPLLLQTPAAVRWLSAEPLLGPIALSEDCEPIYDWRPTYPTYQTLRAIHPDLPDTTQPIRIPGKGLDWVVVGGESGPGARPMAPAWARQLRDFCVGAEIPFLFKQWGAHDEQGNRVGKHAAGRELDGRTWDEYPVTGEVLYGEA